MKTAPKVIGCPLLSLEDVYNRHCLRRAHSILRDSSHPGHNLFELLPSGRRYRAIRSKTNRLKNCFYPRAVISLNNAELQMTALSYQSDLLNWLTNLKCIYFFEFNILNLFSKNTLIFSFSFCFKSTYFDSLYPNFVAPCVMTIKRF